MNGNKIKRLKDKIEVDMVKINHTRDSDNKKSNNSKKWEDIQEVEDDHGELEISTKEKVQKSSTHATKLLNSTIQKVQPPFLDPNIIYWEELYVYFSGMHFEPEAKAYYTLIDQQGIDLVPLYYN